MCFEHVYIPYGGYWTTPFCRWQGSFASQHALRFAGEVARRALAERDIPPTIFDSLILGMTIPQAHSFYGAPWLAGLIGAPGLTGPTINQACATSARVVATAAYEVESGTATTILGVACDRTSNGPHIYYPDPLGPGGKGYTEEWVWDNFGFDPYARNSMLQTAENVAREGRVTKAEQDEVVLLRYEQYQDALKDDAAFHRRYMITPITISDPSGRKTLATVIDDEGIYPTSAEGLARLQPVMEGGTVSYGSQTHPADGNAGIIVATRERARALSADPTIEIQLLAFGQGRTRPGYMAQAVVPAAQQALERARLSITQIDAIKTHNPFAVNDIYFAREMGVDLTAMNNYGSSLIFGHPQGPTGLRLIIELIEELVVRGGGYGLFAGCAAGDTAAAIVLKVAPAA